MRGYPTQERRRWKTQWQLYIWLERLVHIGSGRPRLLERIQEGEKKLLGKLAQYPFLFPESLSFTPFLFSVIHLQPLSWGDCPIATRPTEDHCLSPCLLAAHILREAQKCWSRVRRARCSALMICGCIILKRKLSTSCFLKPSSPGMNVWPSSTPLSALLFLIFPFHSGLKHDGRQMCFL